MIGVVVSDPGWETILRQIGVAYERLDWNRLAAQHYAVVVINRSLSRAEHVRIEAYVRDGGAVLDNGHFVSGLGLASKSVYIDSIVGGTEPFQSLWVLDVDDRVSPLRVAQHLDRTVALVEQDGGFLAHVPFALARVLRSSSTRRRRFHAASGPHPDEVVARRSRNPYRVVIEGALRWLHEARGLPFLHLWHLPERQQSLFAFRIDSDFGTPISCSDCALLPSSTRYRCRSFFTSARIPTTLTSSMRSERTSLRCTGTGIAPTRHTSATGETLSKRNRSHKQAVLMSEATPRRPDNGTADSTVCYASEVSRTLRSSL